MIFIEDEKTLKEILSKCVHGTPRDINFESASAREAMINAIIKEVTNYNEKYESRRDTKESRQLKFDL